MGRSALVPNEDKKPETTALYFLMVESDLVVLLFSSHSSRKLLDVTKSTGPSPALSLISLTTLRACASVNLRLLESNTALSNSRQTFNALLRWVCLVDLLSRSPFEPVKQQTQYLLLSRFQRDAICRQSENNNENNHPCQRYPNMLIIN